MSDLVTTAVLLTIYETCKMRGVNPCMDYLNNKATRIPMPPIPIMAAAQLHNKHALPTNNYARQIVFCGVGCIINKSNTVNFRFGQRYNTTSKSRVVTIKA